MSKNIFDGLDKFFRAQFSKAESAEDGWNVPPDDPFFAAMNQINASKKKKRRRFIFWILIGAIGVSLIAFGISTKNRIDGLQAKIEVLNHKNEELSARNEEKLSKEKIEAQTPLHDGKQEANNTIITKNIKSPKVEQRLKSSVYEVGHSAPKVIRNKKSATSNNEESYTVSKRLETNMLPKNNDDDLLKLQESLNRIDLLRIQTLAYAISLPELNLFSFQKSQKEQIRRPLELSFHTGHLLSSLQMKNTDGFDFTLTRYEKVYNGWQIGTGLQVPTPLKRLDALFSTSYKRINNESLYEGSTEYDNNYQSILQNDTTYSQLINIQTPMGSTMNRASFQLNGEGLSEGKLMDNKTYISQEFDLLSLGLGLAYTPIKTKKIDASIGFEIAGNYILNTNQSIETELFYAQQKMMDRSTENQIGNDLNRLFYSLGANVSASYHLNNSYSLFINTGYERSLTSLRKLESSMEPSTYLSNIKTSVGIKLRLN